MSIMSLDHPGVAVAEVSRHYHQRRTRHALGHSLGPDHYVALAPGQKPINSRHGIGAIF